MFVMKKYMVLLLFLIGSSMPLYNQIDSIWIGKSYEPCNLGPLMNDTCRSSSGWIGPKTDTTAGVNADPSCNPLCVFIVVYAVCDEVIHSLAQNPNDLYGQNSFERFYSTMEGMKKGESYVVSSTNEAKSINTKIHSDNEAIIYDLMGNALGKRRALDYMYDYLDRGVYFILEKNKDEVLRIIKVYIEK